MKRKAIVIGLGVLAWSCQPKQQLSGGQPVPTAVQTHTSDTLPPEDVGEELRVALADAQAEQTPVSGPSLQAGEPLTGRALDALVARIPGDPPQGFATDLHLPAQGRKPPVAGGEVGLAFAPETSAAPVDDGQPARLLGIAPDGEVAILPRLSVRFDRSVVGLGAPDALAASVPVTLSPKPEGQWRWMGTQTLVFEPAGVRLPMASTYTVTLEAGSPLPNGQVVAQTQAFTVSTPPPGLVRTIPANHATQVDLQPVIALSFDQAVRSEDVLAHAKLSGAELRLATPAEVAADRSLALRDPSENPDRVVFLRPTTPLESARNTVLTLAAGLGSAEGPRQTPEPLTTTFLTHDVLHVKGTSCSKTQRCEPGYGWGIEFTTPLASDQDLASLLTFTPEIEGLSLSVYGTRVWVGGLTQPNTTYRAQISGDLRDVFGQTLGSSAEVSAFFGAGAPRYPEIAELPRILMPDPRDPSHVTVYVRGLKQVRVDVSTVREQDWAAWNKTSSPSWGEVPSIFGKPLEGALRKIDDPNVWSPVRIDLPAHDTTDRAGLVVQVSTPPGTSRKNVRTTRAWVVPSPLVLSAVSDTTDLVVSLIDARTGGPVAGADITLGGLALGKTDAHGFLHTQLPEKPAEYALLVARTADDITILTPSGSDWNRSWAADRSRGIVTLIHVIDDRHLYRPLETAHVRGWVRRVDFGKKGDLLPLDGQTGEVSWALHDAQGVQLGSGQAHVDARGAFDLDLHIPEDANLGQAGLDLSGMGGSAWHSLDIQAFRRPTFEVSVAEDDPRAVIARQSHTLTAKATEFAGDTLKGAEVAWQVTAERAHWQAPGWDRYTFGRALPMWGWWWRPLPDLGVSASWQAHTDAVGEHTLAVTTSSWADRVPVRLQATATISNVDRQTRSASTQFLVHPAQVAVGVAVAEPVVELGKGVRVELIAVSIDGEPEPGVPIRATLFQTQSTWQAGRWVESVRASQDCDVTSAQTPVSCAFKPDAGGSWTVRAVVADASGRESLSEQAFWVSGPDPVPTTSEPGTEPILMLADKASYAPGETAKIRVQLPFAGGTLQWTISRAGLLDAGSRVLVDAGTTLEVPITEADMPALNLDLAASGVREGPDGAPLIAFGQGHLRLEVPPHSRELSVAILPAQDLVAPGAQTSVELRVHDASEQPVAAAEVNVFMVDEAVLALSDGTWTNPLETFYPDRSSGVDFRSARGWIRLEAPPQAETSESYQDDAVESENEGLGAGGALQRKGAPVMMAMRAISRESADALPMPAPAPGAGRAPIALRADFRADALWVASVQTDAQGRVRVPVSMPDSLTRWRVVAVAADDTRFGLGEQSLVSRLPVSVEPSLPRLLRVGDVAELPFVLHNRTAAAQRIDLAVRTGNLTLEGGQKAGRSVLVAAGGVVEVRIPARAVKAGRAVVQVAITSKAGSDAAEVTFPVYTPATREAFAAYGSLDGASNTRTAFERLDLTDDVFSQAGGLDLSFSTTKLATLADAVFYLRDYPYTWPEPRASRVLAIAALHEVLDAFRTADLPDPAALVAVANADLVELSKQQNADGGFDWWQRGRPSNPFVSVHVTHALVRAKDAGLDVDAGSLQRALRAIGNLDRLFPADWPKSARWSLKAYAIAVRQVAGEETAKDAAALFAEAGLDGLGPDGLGWLVPSLEGTARTQALDRLRDRMDETASTAHVVTSWSEEDAALILHGSRRADAVVLDALLQTDAASPLIDKLTEGLVASAKQGHWGSTQEDAWVLLALQRVFREREALTPDLVARAWVGPQLVAEKGFQGRERTTSTLRVPMAWLLRGHAKDTIALSREGQGRLYWRLGLEMVPKNLELRPSEQGFSVTRLYEAIDDPSDVTRDAQGVWHVKAGARVRVKLAVTAPSTRHHVLLSDPLPSGFEAVNPALVGSEPVPEANSAGLRPAWWWGSWFEYEALRDDRVEAATTTLWPAVHAYTYTARATTPGVFVAPPAQALELYHPETFGRTGTERVVIE